MSKYVRTIYLYVVAFVTLCMIIAGFVGTISNLVEYLCPTVNYYSEYKYGTTNYELEYQKELEMVKRSNIKEMFTFIATTVVGVPLFIYHWKSILKDSNEEV